MPDKQLDAAAARTHEKPHAQGQKTLLQKIKDFYKENLFDIIGEAKDDLVKGFWSKPQLFDGIKYIGVGAVAFVAFGLNVLISLPLLILGLGIQRALMPIFPDSAALKEGYSKNLVNIAAIPASLGLAVTATLIGIAQVTVCPLAYLANKVYSLFKGKSSQVPLKAANNTQDTASAGANFQPPLASQFDLTAADKQKASPLSDPTLRGGRKNQTNLRS